jgi:hypothetical protein
LVSVQPSEIGAVGEERAADRDADIVDGAEPVVFREPDQTLLDGVVVVAAGGPDAALQPADVAKALLADGRRRKRGQANAAGSHPV